MFRTLEGVRAPELIWKDENDWINSKPLYLKDLRPKPVLIDFWDYTCVNCIRTLPYLKEWHKRYSSLGLVIIGIHTPEFKFASQRENVENAVKEFGMEYPVLLDDEYQNWRAFANRYWPRKYLIDKDGYIVYDHAGEGDYGLTEQFLQEHVKVYNPDVELPEIMEPVRPTDQAGAVCYPMTPELYAGYYRGLLGNAVGYQPERVIPFVDPGNHKDGVIYAHGPWFNGDEFMRHARKTDRLEDYIAIRYHALEVNAVVRSADGKPFDVVVTQDDRPLAKEDAGRDIQFADGKSFFRVDEPRMYNVVANREYGNHELKLFSTSDSFEIYAFTFVSCEEPD